MSRIAYIFSEVLRERARQDSKWGEQNHTPVEWIAILTEEVGEAAREGVDFYFRNGLINPVECETNLERNIQLERIEKYRKECIQVAAVAVQMIESLDRQTQRPEDEYWKKEYERNNLFTRLSGAGIQKKC